MEKQVSDSAWICFTSPLIHLIVVLPSIALHIAAQEGDIETATCLLKAGADKEIPNVQRYSQTGTIPSSCNIIKHSILLLEKVIRIR